MGRASLHTCHKGRYMLIICRIRFLDDPKGILTSAGLHWFDLVRLCLSKNHALVILVRESQLTGVIGS